MKIDVTQAIADLSDSIMSKLQEEGLKRNPHNLPFPNGIIKENDDGGISYTEEAQKCFNSLNNELLEIIKENEITE